MSLSVVFPYTKAYGDFATAYAESIHRWEPTVQVVSINTETEADYRYTRALNAGAKQAVGDWLLFSNDDILCTGKFLRQVEQFERGSIYGMELRQKTKAGWGADVEYLYGWILLMHRELFEDVGPFEEFYLHAGFDDIDYCWRAQQLGYGLVVAPLPFVHLADQPGGKHRRYEVPGYREQMARSKRFFIGKTNLIGRGYSQEQASSILSTAIERDNGLSMQEAFAHITGSAKGNS